MALEKELSTYRRELEKIQPDQEGKFILIKGDNVVALYDTYSDALRTGYEKFGLEPFLVKQLNTIEKVHFFTRELSVCHI